MQIIPRPAVRMLLGYGVTAALAGACSAPESMQPITDKGGTINNLFLLVLALSALVFLLVAALLGWALVRYRARPGDGEGRQTEGNRGLEIAWTAGPLLLLALVFVITVRVMRTVDGPARAAGGDDAALRVEVIGHQWWWEYRYPDLGIVTANELHLPVGVPLRLELRSDDVIHSFWVPQFGWKMDLIPTKTNVMNLRVDEAGTYDGACTEYCGLQHAWMRLRVTAESRDDFNAWAAAQRRPAAPPAAALARGQQIFLANTCVSCHAVGGAAAGGQVGPNLTHLGSRATIGAGIIENTPDNLTKWIANARSIKPGVRMPRYALSDADMQALVVYLESLK